MRLHDPLGVRPIGAVQVCAQPTPRQTEPNRAACSYSLMTWLVTPSVRKRRKSRSVSDSTFSRSPMWARKSGGHLRPVTLKPVIRIFRTFRVFMSSSSAFLLPRTSSDPCFSGVRGTSAFPAFSPYRVRIADFKNPTDRLYCDRPWVTGNIPGVPDPNRGMTHPSLSQTAEAGAVQKVSVRDSPGLGFGTSLGLGVFSPHLPCEIAEAI